MVITDNMRMILVLAAVGYLAWYLLDRAEQQAKARQRYTAAMFAQAEHALGELERISLGARGHELRGYLGAR